MNKRGFTLVELAIVLVVIGLLTGGVLVAQSMVSTAKISALVSQLKQYDAAISNFRLNFRALPGDATLITPPGNRDSYLVPCEAPPAMCFYTMTNMLTASDDPSGYLTGGSYVNVFHGEILAFWGHLSITGMLKEQLTPFASAATGLRTDVNIPNTPFDDVGVIPTLVTGIFEASMRNFNALVLVNTRSTTNNVFNFNDGIGPAEYIALDFKMDNGVPNSGDLVASKQGQTNTCGAEDTYYRRKFCIAMYRIR